MDTLFDGEGYDKVNTRQFYINPGKVLDYDEAKTPLDFNGFVAMLKKAYADGYNAVRCKNTLDDTDGALPVPLEMRADQSLADVRFSVQRTTRLAPNGKRSNLTDRQYDQVRTPAFKAWFGDWEAVAERKAQAERIADWMTQANIDAAKGKTREQIFAEFGNDLEPIATIPAEYLPFLSDGITDSRVYSGKGYMIDHAVNHHPEVSVEEYLGIQSIIDNADDVKLDDRNKKRNKSILFIKNISPTGVVVVSFDDTDGGKIVLHKSFFNKMKAGRFDKYPSIRVSSEVGNPSISHTADAAPAVRLSALEDGNSVPNRVAESQGVSRVVDENGEPLVVYHGADNVYHTFDQKQSFHTTSQDAAKTYAIGENGLVQANYVKAANPLVVSANGGDWISIETPQVLRDRFAGEAELPDGRGFKAIFDEFYMSARDMAVFAKAAGFDALIVKDVKDNYDGEEFTGDDIVTFEPTQVKSATDNTGAFSPTNPDTRFSVVTIGNRKVAVNESEPLTTAEAQDETKVRAVLSSVIGKQFDMPGELKKITVDKKFADEFWNSKYSAQIRNTREKLWRAKVSAVPILGEVVGNTTLGPAEAAKHLNRNFKKRATFYRCKTEFGLKRWDGIAVYPCDLIVIETGENRYVYDIVGIGKPVITAAADLAQADRDRLFGDGTRAGEPATSGSIPYLDAAAQEGVRGSAPSVVQIAPATETRAERAAARHSVFIGSTGALKANIAIGRLGQAIAIRDDYEQRHAASGDTEPFDPAHNSDLRRDTYVKTGWWMGTDGKWRDYRNRHQAQRNPHEHETSIQDGRSAGTKSKKTTKPLIEEMVGRTRFELVTFCTPSQRQNR